MFKGIFKFKSLTNINVNGAYTTRKSAKQKRDTKEAFNQESTTQSATKHGSPVCKNSDKQIMSQVDYYKQLQTEEKQLLTIYCLQELNLKQQAKIEDKSEGGRHIIKF